MIRVGQKFRDERQRLGLTLEEVSKATKIRVNFLSAIERGEYHNLPSSAYATGFVKNYSDFLGLSSRETLALFRREFDAEKTFQSVSREAFPVKRFKLSEKVLYIVAIFVLLSLYMIFQYRAVFINPPLTVSSPKNGEVVTSSEVKIKGKTDPNVTVSVNNMPVPIDSKGVFEKNLSVFAGKETITVEAVNRFGRKTQEIIHLTVKPPGDDA